LTRDLAIWLEIVISGCTIGVDGARLKIIEPPIKKWSNRFFNK
jgi:hypothetical protein